MIDLQDAVDVMMMKTTMMMIMTEDGVEMMIDDQTDLRTAAGMIEMIGPIEISTTMTITEDTMIEVIETTGMELTTMMIRNMMMTKTAIDRTVGETRTDIDMMIETDTGQIITTSFSEIHIEIDTMILIEGLLMIGITLTDMMIMEEMRITLIRVIDGRCMRIGMIGVVDIQTVMEAMDQELDVHLMTGEMLLLAPT